MVKENKLKNVEDMKSSEIINLLNEDHSEAKFNELEDELISRYPFSWYFKTKFEEIEEQINKLNKLLRHDHKDGKVVIEL